MWTDLNPIDKIVLQIHRIRRLCHLRLVTTKCIRDFNEDQSFTSEKEGESENDCVVIQSTVG